MPAFFRKWLLGVSTTWPNGDSCDKNRKTESVCNATGLERQTVRNDFLMFETSCSGGARSWTALNSRCTSFDLCAATPDLAEKVACLSRSATYGLVDHVIRHETHMSWVFLAGNHAFKLKKPVRFPYLDFSTVSRREAACRAELILNRRLAPDVYQEVLPLVQSERGLTVGGPGTVTDWLVVMRRLDEKETLEHAIRERQLAFWQLDRLVAALIDFYRRAHAVFLSPDVRLARWQESLAYNRRVLLDPRLDVPAGQVRRVDRAQRLFLARRSQLIAARARGRHIVAGHGDLRPEHIWLGDPVRIIDCIEFNAGLRAVDPFDEIAFLCLECERLGAGWAGAYLKRRFAQESRDRVGAELYAFYRCHRATLRARLAIAHLLEADRRTPEKWPRLARTYLRIALSDAKHLERTLRTPGGRSG
jgi:aminoglycoside phosphotransferase family enzyme